MPLNIDRPATAVLALCLAAACVSWTPSAGAQESPQSGQADADRTRAQTLVADGLDHARGKRFKEAAELFDAALKLYPHPEIAHNLGRAREELGNLAAAIASFRAALEMDANYVYAGDARKRVSALDRKLRKTHALLQIRSVPSAARVSLQAADSGDQTVLVTPLEYWMPAGRVVVRGAKSGFEDASIELDVKAGQELPVEVVLKPVAAKGFLTVTAGIDGAEVMLNGAVVGVTPLRGHLAPAGSYTLRVTAADHEAWEQSVVVEADKEKPIHVTLVQVAAAGPAESDSVAADDTPVETLTDETPLGYDDGGASGLGIAGGVLVGVGVAAAAGGAVLTWLAYDRQAQAELVPNDGQSFNDKEFTRLSNNAKAMDVAGAVVLSVAAGALVAGVVMLVLPGGDEDATGEESARWAPFAVPSSDGFGVGATVSF